MTKITTLLLSLVAATTAFAQIGAENVKLAELVKRGKETNSDAVIVIQDGKIVVEEYYDKPKGPVYIASAGKNLTALAVGKLLDQGKIKSLDQPVSDFYPEWLQGNKQKITIRMLLNHTSGLQNVANAGVELERGGRVSNSITLALAAELSNPPGTFFSYNNKAVGLLGGIIEKASGQRMDRYYEEAFFSPMKIKEFDWIRDEDGNPAAYGAFVLTAMDFAKFGTLMLDHGKFEGQQVLSESFVAEALKSSQNFLSACGLLWWRYPRFSRRVIDEEKIAELEKAGVSREFVDKLRPFRNVMFENNDDYSAALEKTLGKDWSAQFTKASDGKGLTLSKRIFSDEILAYYANGFRGNYLIIVPKTKTVAVRVVRNSTSYNSETDGFVDFNQRVVNLSYENVPPPPI